MFSCICHPPGSHLHSYKLSKGHQVLKEDSAVRLSIMCPVSKMHVIQYTIILLCDLCEAPLCNW